MNSEQDSSTRKLILTMLKTRSSMTVSEMAKELGITEMAVRRHLNTLERDSLIESKLVRQAMGRPTHLYSLTLLADDLFPKKYHHLTLDLLGELAEEAGEDVVDGLFERRKKKLISRYGQRMEGKELKQRVAELAEIQNSNGYMVEWEQDGEGNYVFKEHNCPISQVANQYNHACACELNMFEQLLSADVKRTECLAKGGTKCIYIIQDK
ncbi:helix-turn-helix transcriptional regulator [Paenibacillus thalictri]|uniref:Transcriptional regulator n=1 Tax=Paenibacillus thalictri TaxID=2527873 RepID=A0A4Q9DVS4_9BACL|nr:metalloregulator ArsR/SmtB family transcription factor [Paenibacillus thalictri]TBL81154.1 transcriptional regulator [Paenibacillus thalictri]